jgi:transcriptional regulator with XRE-family HTH domain
MTDRPTDGHIDQLVKARWLAIGLSQTDLAEVLDAAFQQTDDGNGSNWVDTDRLMQIAEALEIPVDLFYDQAVKTKQRIPGLSSAQCASSLQSVLALRLMRAFQDLTDLRTKEVLVQLAEQIVKRQAKRRGDRS